MLPSLSHPWFCSTSIQTYCHVTMAFLCSAVQYFSRTLYRIDIGCELNIDYEHLLIPTSNDIKNHYWTQTSPKICVIFRYWVVFYWKSRKTCSLSKFGMVFGGHYCISKNRIWMGRISNRTQKADTVQHFYAKGPNRTWWQSMPNMTNNRIILHKRPFWTRGTVLYYTWTLAQPAHTESVSSRSLWIVEHSVQPVTAKQKHRISIFKWWQLSIMSFPLPVWHSVAGLLHWNPNQWCFNHRVWQ